MNEIKTTNIFFAIIFSLLFFQTTVFANQGTVLTVDTTLNVESIASENDDSPAALETQWVWHPISVVNEPMNGFNTIRRTYALPPDVNPAVIATDDFEMFGQRFIFAYVLQQPTSNEAFIEIRESVTIETRSRDLSDILPYLEQEILYERDGFAGTLTLDIHSITSEAAGTTRYTSTATRQRNFPHLPAPDNSLIPRTIDDNGTTFHLSSVYWESSSVSAIDGHPVASNFTAHATFTAQVTQSRTTGYIVTAEYAGTVFRTTQGKTLFTAIFYGEPIIEILPEEIETILKIQGESEALQEIISQPVPRNERNCGTGKIVIIALAALVALMILGVLAAGGLFLSKYFLGYNATVYSIDGPREIVKAGKIKIDLTSPEPTIVLNKIVSQSPAKTGRYIIQIAKRAIPKLINKAVRVVLYDKEVVHNIPYAALSMPVYEFEVNFSDDGGSL
jgi:hypothetical protein